MSQISNNFDYFANDLSLNLNNYAINYDFRKSGNIIQAARLTGNTLGLGNPASDRFGYSTSLSSLGNVLAVGAYSADTNAVNDAGAVYIFSGGGNSWVQTARLTGNTFGSGNPDGDLFGHSTSLNSAGNVLAVGANLADTNAVNDAGAVYLFTGVGNSWAQAARLTGNTLGLGNPDGDLFGHSTSLNSAGNVLSVGASNADTNAVNFAGAVYIFTGGGNSWVQTARLTGDTLGLGNPASDNFGYSTSLNSLGSVLAVGASNADTNAVNFAGAVYIFTGGGNSWVQTARLTGDTLGLGNPASDNFGWSTSLNSDGNVLSVGAFIADTAGAVAGAVYIFTGGGNSWVQTARLTGNTLGLGDPQSDLFGSSTSLNSDGSVLAVGAYLADTNAANDAGAVYIFTGGGNSWVQTARLTGNTLGLGNPNNDFFGYSTSLNSLGNILTVGAIAADTNGVATAGAAYIFNINSSIKNLSVFSGFYSGEIKNDQGISLLQNNNIFEFDGSNYIEVKNATGLKNNFFTIYCAYQRNSGEEAILFSSLHSIDNINYSGFNFGITKYNNYYYEYNDLASGPKVYISSRKADTKGIVALTKNLTTININTYDSTEELFEFESFEIISDTDKLNKFLIGSCDNYPLFSGKNFIGKMNALIYLNESLNSTYLNDAADGFIYDINKNVILENIEEIYSFSGFQENIPSGFFDTTSGNLLNCLNNYSFYDYPGFISGVISGSITGGIHKATGFFTGFTSQTFNYTKNVERFFSNIVITGTNTGYELVISGTGYTGYVNINAGEIVNICGTGTPIYFISGLGGDILYGRQLARLTGNTLGLGNPADNFVRSTSINSLGNVLAAGAYLADTNTVSNAGAVYIFTGGGNSWVQTARLTGNTLGLGNPNNDFFGASTSLSSAGNVLAVGAHLADTNAVNDAGAVYLFTGVGNSWAQAARLTGNTLGLGNPSSDQFGISTSLNSAGNVLAVGAYLADTNAVNNAGAVYIFSGGGNSWVQTARLTGDTFGLGNPAGDEFGISTSLNSAGNVLAVGAYNADTAGASAGAVYIFTGDGNSWVQTARLTGNTLGLGNPASDRFGYSTSFDSQGNILAIGAYNADTTGVSAGAVYLFTGSGSSWVQTARLTGNTLGLGNPASDNFGWSTSLNSDGNVLSVGAYNADTNAVNFAGAVYLFTGGGNSWVQTARLTGNTLGLGNPAVDLFGVSTSLNSDGNVLAVVAESAETNGVNSAGAVYIFDLDPYSPNGILSGLVITGIDQLTGLITGIELLQNQTFLETINFPFSGNINSLFNSFVNTGNYVYQFTIENNNQYITQNEQIKFSNSYLTGAEIFKTTNLLVNRFTSIDKNINYLNSIGIEEVIINNQLDVDDVVEIYAFDFEQDYSPILNENGEVNVANRTFRVLQNKNIKAIFNNGRFESDQIELPNQFDYFVDDIDRISGNYDLDDLILIDFIKTGFSGYYYDGGAQLIFPAHKDFLYSYGKKLVSGIDYFQSGNGETYRNISALLEEGYIYGYNSILNYELISGNKYNYILPRRYPKDTISVYLNGLKQDPITDYTEKSKFDLIFNPVFFENTGQNIYNTNDSLDVNK